MKKSKIKITAMIGASLLTAVLCAGCSSEREEIIKAEGIANAKRCWDTGGMTVRSIWDDRFIDCVYPK